MTMKKFLAALLPVVTIIFAIALATPTMAQNEPPRAAPTGEAAQTAPLAAPPGITQSDGAIGPTAGGYSIVTMFLHADPLVKTVMGVLLLASLWSWTIIINKALALSRLGRRATKFEKVFWSGQSLDELFAQFASRNDHPFATVFVSGVREWRRAFEHGAPRESAVAGVKDRVEKAMSVTISRETDAIEGNIGFLATVANTAPFVGLFGTVWGIMNSFAAIAARHDTTLAVVAPGIAEALFATAMGLLAAIPAAIFYNRYVGEIGRYTNRLDAFADELSAILSRQLDEKAR
ncbi:MAG: protein TolQ [Alphaproteobacteria bacterium]|nr:protein TolQ [Alphaproteobacteria bacterium]MDE1987970.1 protein TolQ [Alphaproteobacteria bacterium]MDE2164601.1 protein TolQ [Alphaproteobacteria bacterium]MDE2266696.1 protein TolQ [Alphaproteobacteria bacterium]MDE2501162.1 protein TolQ [Alphaproteobacteria bacterium]